MRFEEGSDDRLIGVSLLTEDDDVLLATKQGKAIRFAATDVREFQSRDSTGVRGARLAEGDEVISMSVLRGFAATPQSGRIIFAPRRGRKASGKSPVSRAHGEFEAAEEFILTVTANGYGKRTSAYEYRRTNRGGQGITNIVTSDRNGPVVASFPAHNGEQLMLVTDQAKLIRTTVGSVRVTGRNTQGVILFRVAPDEHVVSAARIEESEEEAEAVLTDGADAEAPLDDPVQVEDGTGPHTNSQSISEDDGEIDD
jgi:DNA gyrase subunit A